MAGVIGSVAVLIGIILFHEPEGEGVSRAAAYKAAALSIASVEECVGESYAQKSYFDAKDKSQWYVKYMDYLYRRDMILPELTPADMETAEGILTYEEAAYLMRGLKAAMAAGEVQRTTVQKDGSTAADDGKDSQVTADGSASEEVVRVTRWNRRKAYPAEEWWEFYREYCVDTQELTGEEAETENQQTAGALAVRELPLLIYATPDNMPDAESWMAYTDDGYYRFEGLALGRYLDNQVKVYVRDREIVHVAALLAEDVVYKNVWILEAGDQSLVGYLGEIQRELESKKKMKTPEQMESQVADIHMSKGQIKKVVLKKERISGKVLAVRDDAIEIEGYGSVPLDDNFSIYKLYGQFARQDTSEILVGYESQEFVVADGKLCAALTMRPFEADRIRVLIMDTGFQSAFHESIELEFLCSGTYTVDNRKQSFSSGETMTLTGEHELLKAGRIIFEPDDELKGVRVNSLERSYGAPVYPGRLEVSREADGLVLVNELYLEDYLKRVVPSEMPVSYEKEALKAQAVCARTYAYRQIQGNSYMEYGAHVDDSTRFQVYNNLETSTNSDMAVNETYGQLLTYEGRTADAFYFSTSCGHTTDGTIWGASLEDVPYLTGIAVTEDSGQMDLTSNEDFAQFIKSTPDAYEDGFAMYRWSTKLTSRQLEEKVSDIGTITNLTMKERSTGGIGSVLLIEGTEGTREIVGESKIRSTLGHPELVIRKKDGETVTGWSSLPSAFITIERSQPDADNVTTFTIYGGGFGHGVGMSQNGAQGMAKEGKNYREILEFFYTGAEVKSMDGD